MKGLATLRQYQADLLPHDIVARLVLTIMLVPGEVPARRPRLPAHRSLRRHGKTMRKSKIAVLVRQRGAASAIGGNADRAGVQRSAVLRGRSCRLFAA